MDQDNNNNNRECHFKDYTLDGCIVYCNTWGQQSNHSNTLVIHVQYMYSCTWTYVYIQCVYFKHESSSLWYEFTRSSGQTLKRGRESLSRLWAFSASVLEVYCVGENIEISVNKIHHNYGNCKYYYSSIGPQFVTQMLALCHQSCSWITP